MPSESIKNAEAKLEKVTPDFTSNGVGHDAEHRHSVLSGHFVL
jgi:hypothetical protein